MTKTLAWIGAAALVVVGVLVYRSKSPVETVKDKVGDAVQGTGQVIEKAGHKIKEAAR